MLLCGEYQLLVEMMEPQGLGALQLAFEQLKKKLAAEGLFEAARKRLPDIAFEVADIREWRPKEPLDVILANAVLRWVADHETLLPALIGKLKIIDAFSSQAAVREYLEPDLIVATSRYWSRFCEGNHAEPFEVVRDRAATRLVPTARGPADRTWPPPAAERQEHI